MIFTAHQIRRLRRSLKLTGLVFADRLGVSYATVLAWEAGRRHPKFAHLEKLSRLARSLNGAAS